jgi:Tfp pilus assembly protein PilO
MTPVYSAIFRQRGLLHLDALGIGVCVLASLACYVITVQPIVKQRSAVAAQGRELRAQQEKASELQAAISAAKTRLVAARDELAAGTVKLESTAHLNTRVAGLTEFFSGWDLRVDDVQTGQVRRGLRYDVVPITMVGRGAYRQCVAFFHGFCSAFLDMSVSQIELMGNPAQSSGSEAFKFELLWYAAPSAEAPAVSRDGLPGEVRS